MRRVISLLPLVITGLGVIAVSVFIRSPEIMHAQMEPDVFKLTYQFLLMVVLGSAVTLSFQAIAVGRDAREKRQAMHRDIHDALVTSYNDVKQARRLLRARARIGGNGPDVAANPRLVFDEYDGQMEAISRAQLGLELVIRRIEFNARSFRRADEIVRSLKTVEKYVNTVIDEWEDIRRKSRRLPQLTVGDLSALDDFLRHYDDAAKFGKEFKQAFKTALQLLERAVRAG